MSTDETTTAATPPADSTHPEAGAPAPGATRILVAEDETLIRLDLVEMLGELGYDVVGQASNGEQAVALAREGHRIISAPPRLAALGAR